MTDTIPESTNPRLASDRSDEFRRVVIDALVVSHIYQREHETDPHKALADLIADALKEAQDPALQPHAASDRSAVEAVTGIREAADLMKERACRAHRLCYELMLRHPEIPELGDMGALHCSIHDILAVDVPDTAIPAGMLPWHGGDSAPADASDPVVILTRGGSFTCMAKEAVHWRYGTYIYEIGKPMPARCDVIAYTPKPAATSAPTVPAGWRLAPVEPNTDMQVAAREKYGKPIGHEAASGCWSAMLAAAPSHPGRVDVEGLREALRDMLSEFDADEFGSEGQMQVCHNARAALAARPSSGERE